MEIILDELVQFTTEKINNIGFGYYRENYSNFIDKKFLHVVYDKNKNINDILLFEYDVTTIRVIEAAMKFSKNYHQLYLFEHDFVFEKIYTITKDIQKNQLNNCSNKFRKIQIIKSNSFINIINKYNKTNENNYWTVTNFLSSTHVFI